MEWNDVYDNARRLTGRRLPRGAVFAEGEYGLAVCVWVYDGCGNILLTQRAPQKSYPGTWENSGGAAQAGESSRQAIRRELFEETGIVAEEDAFEFVASTRSDRFFFDHYFLRCSTPVEKIVLQPGETSDVKWVTLDEAHTIALTQMCEPIRKQFFAFAPLLKAKQVAQG